MSKTPGKVLVKIQEAKTHKFTVLDLYEHPELEVFPPELLELKFLKRLRIGGTEDQRSKIREIPKEIVKLENLTSLELRYNEIVDLPDSLTELSSLSMLDISRNSLEEFPKVILRLHSLETLMLSYNKLTQIAWTKLGYLPNLKKLSLNYNRLEELPDSIVDLLLLEELHLRANSLEKLPLGIFLSLKNLKLLDIAYNKITELSQELVQANQLRYLILNDNPLVRPPIEIARQGLPSIKDYFHALYQNNEELLKELSGQKTSLINQKRELLLTMRLLLDTLANTREESEESEGSYKLLERYKKLIEGDTSSTSQFAEKYGNKLSRILKVNQEVLEHLNSDLYHVNNELHFTYSQLGEIEEKLKKIGVKNYEVKLILIGNGRVGKTSIARRLISNHFDKNEPLTHGILIKTFNLPILINIASDSENLNEEVQLKVNTWDFGGQEIYHATHRFFLSTRALYLLVWDQESRENAEKSPEKEENFNFNYWLDYVNTLSKGSPILMVQNKVDLTKTFIDNPNTLVKNYNVKDFIDVSAATNENIEQLKDLIRKQFSQANELKDIIGFDLPAAWIRVKEEVEKLAETKNYISYKQYLKICEDEGLQKESANNLSHNFLHQIGTVLHFPKPKQLKDMVILNPRWATQAVYEVLKAEKIMKTKGYFNEEDLEEIWNDYELSEQVSFIELMKKFELLFEIPNQPQQYIAPQLLSSQKPDILFKLQDRQICFIYQYKFLHKGIITRLITKFSEFAPNGYYWKNGVQIHYENTKALIEAFPRKKQIWVNIENTSKKEFVKEIIQKAFIDVHQDLAVDILIPYSSKKAETTHYFPLEALMRRLDNGRDTVECPLSYDQISIAYLLNGEQLTEEDKQNPKIHIQSLIGMGKIQKAIESFLEYASDQPDLINKLRILQNKFSEIRDYEDLNLINNSDASSQRSKIARALLNFLNE